jgi:hypothetical protein
MALTAERSQRGEAAAKKEREDLTESKAAF